ncbi:MAG: glycosyltransferase family 2 protein [Methyloprofundus sp.]|nr:glycosyltransferase family 2 protein [Methyloprofundus sp.]
MTTTTLDPLVYVIILNYCSFEDTIDCINKIRENTYNNYKILVLDNNSPDLSGPKLKENFPQSEFIQFKKNTGYAGGNNLGIRIALENNADYIFILNPDIRLTTDAIETYVSIMQSDPNLFALNPLQLTEENTLDSKFANAMFSQNGYPIPSLEHPGKKTWQVKTLFGASLFISRQAIEKTGGFDPLFFAYWEEIDLCRRFIANGGKLIVTQQAPAIHLRTKEKTTKPDDFILFLRLKGMYLFRLKNPELDFFKTLSNITRECRLYLREDYEGMFAWKKKHFLKALVWIYINIPKIIFHRYLEKKHNSLYIPTLKKTINYEKN